MRENTIKKIIAYFEENKDVFNDCIEELDSWNGFLGDDRYYEMEMLQDFYNGVDPIEILQRAYYGHDVDTWHTDSRGEKEYGAFNPNRDYFTYNGYGNLISTNYKDYSDKLDNYFIKSLSENRRYICNMDEYEELTALFDELEQDENEEE